MSRLDDSTSMAAPLRTASHCSCVCGAISLVPCSVMMVLTESQTASAAGSITHSISCFRLSTGRTALAGGGAGRSPQPDCNAAASRISRLALQNLLPLCPSRMPPLIKVLRYLKNPHGRQHPASRARVQTGARRHPGHSRAYRVEAGRIAAAQSRLVVRRARGCIARAPVSTRGSAVRLAAGQLAAGSRGLRPQLFAADYRPEPDPGSRPVRALSRRARRRAQSARHRIRVRRGLVHQPHRPRQPRPKRDPAMTATTIGVLLVILCGIIEGIAQVFFKRSALAPDGKQLWIGAGVALFILQALIYTGALQFVEVSTAFPIGSIAFVVAAILSERFLKERVTGTRWTGIVLIIVGVALLVLDARAVRAGGSILVPVRRAASRRHSGRHRPGVCHGLSCRCGGSARAATRYRGSRPDVPAAVFSAQPFRRITLCR